MSAALAAGIAAGGRLLGSVLSRSGSGYSTRDAAADTNAWNRRAWRMTKRQQNFAEKSYLNEREYTRKQNRRLAKYHERAMQIRVRDARKAGLHPLAALGISSNYQPTLGAGYQSAGGFGPSALQGSTPSGSSIGEGIAAASDVVGAYLSGRQTPNQKRLEAATIRHAEAQADHAAYIAEGSRRALLERDARENPTKAHALVDSVLRPPVYLPPGKKYDPRKEPHVRAVERYTRSDGSTGWKYTEDMQMDEAGQVVVGAQDLDNWLSKKWREFWHGLGFDTSRPGFHRRKKSGKKDAKKGPRRPPKRWEAPAVP